MNSSGKFRIGFHVSHPTLSAEAITRWIPLKVRYARSVGSCRVTKTGRQLGGNYSQTDITFEISNRVVDSGEVLLTDFITKFLSGFSFRPIDEIVETGGKCFLLIGIYSDGNMLCDFSAALLSQLATHGIGIKVDFYGGPD